MPDPTPPLSPDDRPASGAAGAGAPGPPDEPQGAPPPGPEETPHARLKRRITARRVGLTLTVLVILLMVVAGSLLIYLGTESGRERARLIAVTQIANLFAEDASIRVERVDGNFLTGARMIGFEVERGGEVVLAVDTLLVDYSLRTLVRRTFSASDLTVIGPRVFVRQREDGTFNVAGLLRPADPDRQGGGFTVLIERAEVRDGRAEVHWYNPRRDSTLVLDRVQADIRDIVSQPDSLHGRLDRVRLLAVAPLGTSRMDVAAAGRFSRSEVVLRRFTAQSSLGSRVRGSGRVGYGEAVRAGDALPLFDADIEAAPFALADARAFGGVALYGSPRLRLTADSDGGTLTVALRGSLASETGGPDASVSIDGELTRPTDGPVRYRAEGQLRHLNPAALTRNPALAADLTGDLRVSLEGSSLRSLDGPFSIALRESAAAGRRIDRLTLAGAFSSGRVTFDLDGAIPGLDLVAEGDARPFERIPTYAVRGRARDVNLALLAPGAGVTGRLAGDIAVEGRGTSVDTFFGTVAASLGRTDITAAGRRYLFDRADLDAVVEAGFVSYDADVTIGNGGGRLVAGGTVDPRQPTLRYTVEEGRAERLNLAVLTGNPAQASSLTGTFTLNGVGTDIRTASLDATAGLRGSSFGATTIASADVEAQLRNGRLAFDAAADLGAAGALTAVGTTRPFEQPFAVEARGTLRRVDLARITGNPAQTSDLSGAYELTTRGLDPQTLTADARIRLTSSSYAGRFVDATDLRVTATSGLVNVAGTVDTPDGSLALNISTRPFDASPAITLADGTCFRNLDAGRLTGNAELQTDLTGCATGRVSGYANLPTAAADLVVTLQPSTINGARIRSALADVMLAGGRAAGTVDAVLGEAEGLPADSAVVLLADGTGGRFRADFDARPFDETPSYALRGTTTALDLAALGRAGANAPRTSLTLDIDVEGRGTDPRTLTLSGDIRTRTSAIAAARVDTLDARFALARGVLTVDTLSVRTDVATADGAGTVALFDVDAASAFRLAGEIRSLDAFRDSTRQNLALRRGAFDLSATGVPGQPLAVAGTLGADGLVSGTVGVQRATATLAATVDRAALSARGLDALVEGAVQGSATAAFDSLTFGERRVLRGRATATLADLATFVAASDSVAFGTPLGVPEAGVPAADLPAAVLPAAPAGRAARPSLAIEADFTVDERRDLTLAAFVQLPRPAIGDAPGLPLTLRLDRAVAGIDSVTWSLVQPTTVVVDEGISVDSLVVRSDAPSAAAQQFVVDGDIRFGGEQDFRVSAQGVDLATLSDLAGLGGLGGDLAADIRLTGTAESPILDGRITAADLRSSQGSVGALDATVSYADGRLGVGATITASTGQTLVATADLPRRISLAGGFDAGEFDPNGAINVSAQAAAFPIEWARPFLNSRTYSDLGGALDLNVTGSGTFGQPELAGTARLTEGRLGVVATGMVYEPITADVAFTNNRIELQRVLVGEPAGAEDAGGIDVTGSVELESFAIAALDLTIAPRGFMVIDTRTYRRLVLDAGAEPLRLTGSLSAPVLRGSVQLARGDIYVTNELASPDIEQVELTAAEIETLERRFGREIAARDTSVSRFTQALDYDLQVDIGRNVWIRSGAGAGIGYDIEFTGEVQATKRPFADGGDLYGEIELVNGNIRTFNRRFELDRGTLVFNGPALAARVDIGASLDIQLSQSQSLAGQSAVEVLLDVTGRLDRNPEIRLSSSPVLEPSDIISLIATGQLASNAGTGAAVGAGTGLLLGSVSSAFEQQANESLGLDLTQVSYENGSIVIKVGKYITDRLFLTAGFVPSSGSSGRRESDLPVQFTLDYEILRWLQAQGEYSGQRGVGGGVVIERSF
ncbi:MAG TPA: translocation/assembly module TamB domain-containing protein [Rubricoccaceae bacterium]